MSSPPLRGDDDTGDDLRDDATGANDRPGDCGVHEGESDRGRVGGVGGFLRTLLSGIPWSESASDEVHCRFDVPPRNELKIRNANGRTRVVGEERDDIAISLERHARAESKQAALKLLEAIHVVPDPSGDIFTLEVEIPTRWNRHGSANIDVRVPRGLRLVVHTSNGRLCLQGINSSVKVRSNNGSVRINDVTGNIEIFTANARVACDCTRGRLVARSSNGKIELGDHRGSVDASTTNGVIHADLEEIGQEGVVLATSNGRIVLELPEEVDAEVDIRVDNGVIRTDRPIESQTGLETGRLRGRLGRGGCPIKLRTSNGTVSIK